jgi:mannitol operon transcriptional antiterminator
MELSTRQRAALGILLRGGFSELTLGQIGTRVGVSGRTIARELAHIAPSLFQNYGLVLSGKSGQGLRVIGEPERIHDCLEEIESARPRELGTEERRRMTAALLIESNGVVKLFSLESDIGTSTAAVRRDLEAIRPWLESNSLALSLRRGIGVALEGPERGKRQALATLLLEEFGEAGIIGLISSTEETEPSPLRTLLLRIVPPGLFCVAESVLSGLPREVKPSLAPRDYLGLVIHLAVGAARNGRGRLLDDTIGASTIERACGSEESLTARLIAEGMARSLSAPFGRVELLSVDSYLKGAKPERTGAGLLSDMDMADLASLQKLIAACGEFYGASFAEDPVLRDGLASHWGPALYRLRTRLPIRNPLLPQIRSDYAELFAAIRAAVDRVFPELGVPDDEIAYLVMHFGSSLQRKTQAGQRFRALIVCSAGIGSAHMLASRIRTELPEIDIVASLSWFDVAAIDRDAWDILVSTIPLPPTAGEHIVVSPLLPEEGIRELRAFMSRRRDSIRASGEKTELESSRLIDLKEMNGRLAAAIGILESIRVYGAFSTPADSGTTRGGWESFLAAAVGRCAADGQIEDASLVLGDLERRSRDHGIILPGSAILFLHARTSGLAKPALSLHILSSAPVAPEAGWERAPSRLVLMLAPPGLDRATQDILNEISSSFLDPRTVEVLESGDETSIRTHYSRHLERYSRSSSGQGA